MAYRFRIPFEAVLWSKWINEFEMGDIYAEGLKLRLQEGVDLMNEPTMKRLCADERFQVEKRVDREYHIIDYGENIVLRISQRLLKNEHFEIWNWYCKHILKVRKSLEKERKKIEALQQTRERVAIGDPVGKRIGELLASAVPYPGDAAAREQNIDY
jgi:hypothetical protein